MDKSLVRKILSMSKIGGFCITTMLVLGLSPMARLLNKQADTARIEKVESQIQQLRKRTGYATAACYRSRQPQKRGESPSERCKRGGWSWVWPVSVRRSCPVFRLRTLVEMLGSGSFWGCSSASLPDLYCCTRTPRIERCFRTAFENVRSPHALVDPSRSLASRYCSVPSTSFGPFIALS